MLLITRETIADGVLEIATQHKQDMADIIRKLSRSVDELSKETGLKQEAILILLASKTGLSKTVLKKVLAGLVALEKDFCS